MGWSLRPWAYSGAHFSQWPCRYATLPSHPLNVRNPLQTIVGVNYNSEYNWQKDSRCDDGSSNNLSR
jgi:hypothetical protein